MLVCAEASQQRLTVSVSESDVSLEKQKTGRGQSETRRSITQDSLLSFEQPRCPHLSEKVSVVVSLADEVIASAKQESGPSEN